MIRDKMQTLISWKDKKHRKPLIINGARQFGKSWLVKYFGENYFANDIIIINFEKQRDLHIIFKQNFDVNLSSDFIGIKEIQNNLLYTYEQDFKKYKPSINNDCLQDIIENITKFVGSQVIYTKLSNRFTIPTIKKGVDLLKTARLINIVPNVSVAGLPLHQVGNSLKPSFWTLDY